MNEVIDLLQCRHCTGPLSPGDAVLECKLCTIRYPLRGGAVVYTDAPPEEVGEVGDPLIFKLKTFFKRYERLYYVLVRIAGALFVGQKTGHAAFADMPAGSLILNLGSGPKIIGQNIVNLDVFAFEGVSVVADAAELPFKDEIFDAVICECLLEHVREPLKVVAEIERVLKRGGLAYVSIPFMDAYHSAPDDYYRWTTSGLREMLKNFDERELKIGWGPTSTLISAVANWLGIVFSFRSKVLYQIVTLGFMVLLSPLKLLDYLFRYYPYATNASVGYYFIGAKK